MIEERKVAVNKRIKDRKMRPGVDVDCFSDGGSPDLCGRFLSSICVSGSRRLECVIKYSMGAAWSAAVSWLADHSIGRHFNNSMPVSSIWLLLQALGCVWRKGGGMEMREAPAVVPSLVTLFPQYLHDYTPKYCYLILAWFD